MRPPRLLILMILLLFPVNAAFSSETDDIEAARRRLAIVPFKNTLVHFLWSLDHMSKDWGKLNTIIGFVDADGTIRDFDQAISKEGGFTKYKRSIAKFLHDDDILLRGFSSIYLGVLNATEFSDEIAALFLDNRYETLSASLEKIDAGMAMISLSMMKNEKHKQQIEKIAKEEVGEPEFGENDYIHGYARIAAELYHYEDGKGK